MENIVWESGCESNIISSRIRIVEMDGDYMLEVFTAQEETIWSRIKNSLSYIFKGKDFSLSVIMLDEDKLHSLVRSVNKSIVKE